MMHLHLPDAGVVDLDVDRRILVWFGSEMVEVGAGTQQVEG